MNAKSPPSVSAAFQSAWYRLTLLIVAAYLAVLWFVLGPSNPGYAVSVVAGTFGLGPAIAEPLARTLPRSWFYVPASERWLHAILGVGAFNWLLEVSGWNRHVAKPMRAFSGARAQLGVLEYGVRANASAHLFCFAIHVVLALFALFNENPIVGALWMLLPGVLVHLYPVLLQRSLMLRLQPLLPKTRA